MKKYTCAVCGKEHETILERARCEEKCVIEAEKALEEKQRNELEAKRIESEEAIYEILSEANEMVAKHLDEYQNLSLTKNFPYLGYIFKKLPWWF